MLSVQSREWFDRLYILDIIEKCHICTLLKSLSSLCFSWVLELQESVHKFGMNFVNTFYANKGVFANSFSFSIVSKSKVLKYITS
jgi:hypothetical protein